MKSLRCAATTVVVALMVGGLGITAAAATSVSPPAGGTWNYGVRSGGIYGSAGQVYSDYYVSRTHKSTACADSSHCDYSGWKDAYTWSNAARMAAGSGNTAYYNVA